MESGFIRHPITSIRIQLSPARVVVKCIDAGVPQSALGEVWLLAESDAIVAHHIRCIQQVSWKPEHPILLVQGD